MFQFIETIKIKDKKFCNIEYHNKRMADVKKSFFNINNSALIEDMVLINNLNIPGTVKCRIVYSDNIEKVEFLPYSMPQVTKLKIVTSEHIEYAFKYFNREPLEQLRTLANNAHDVLIVKNGCITDTSFANIVFFDGIRWVTPSTPLLKGTKRQLYLDSQQIFEQKIRVNDILYYQKARIINAMIDLDESHDIAIGNIMY
jgi:4-amino-4-deoxychorismate lyase